MENMRQSAADQLLAVCSEDFIANHVYFDFDGSVAQELRASGRSAHLRNRSTARKQGLNGPSNAPANTIILLSSPAHVQQFINDLNVNMPSGPRGNDFHPNQEDRDFVTSNVYTVWTVTYQTEQQRFLAARVQLTYRNGRCWHCRPN
ncbi:hypothetical protein HDV02_001775 [Globomyces sp. JEL0801]|nr:hypothetical protein HDV02_001775 [Globomyces sp. JEL0801]